MKRFLSIVLALTMLLTLAACNTDKKPEAQDGETTEAPAENEKGNKVVGDLGEIYDKVNETVDIKGNVSYAVEMADDEDQDALVFNYEICDIEAAEKLTDYIITLPKEDCTTFVVLRYDDGLPSEEAIVELKDVVKTAYMDLRASAIQMYDEVGYQEMVWAIENQDLVWRQYDNALVLRKVAGTNLNTKGNTLHLVLRKLPSGRLVRVVNLYSVTR